MLIGRCAACNTETPYPLHFGGLTVHCKACGAGWVTIPNRERDTPPPAARPVPVRHKPSAEPKKTEQQSKSSPPQRPTSPVPQPDLSEGQATEVKSRVGGYGCLILAIPLLFYGLWIAIGFIAGALRGDAEALGGVCGAFLPGAIALGIAMYLLRRR